VERPGVEPLADYKERFVERNDGKPLPVHTAFWEGF